MTTAEEIAPQYRGRQRVVEQPTHPRATQRQRRQPDDRRRRRHQNRPHPVPPRLQRGGTDDQHRTCPVASDELLNHEARLDGLSEAHVVGDQQVGAGHLNRTHHRVELVVLDLDATAIGGKQRAQIGS